MKRRELFKMLATLAAMPLVSPLAAFCKPKRIVPFVASPEQVKAVNVSESSLRAISAYDPKKAQSISYQQYSDSGRMPTYEGFVYANGANRLWRFDVVRGNDINFKCRNCGTVMAFNRQDFREHGQQCNALFGEQS